MKLLLVELLASFAGQHAHGMVMHLIQDLMCLVTLALPGGCACAHAALPSAAMVHAAAYPPTTAQAAAWPYAGTAPYNPYAAPVHHTQVRTAEPVPAAQHVESSGAMIVLYRQHGWLHSIGVHEHST